MVDPNLLMAIKVIAAIKRTLDVMELKRRMTGVEATVGRIDAKIDAALLTDYHAAFDHLIAAQLASTEELRQLELGNARLSFVRLTHRPVTKPVVVEGKQLTHEQLVVFGHVGNFHYFLLQDDPRQALAEAYLCAEKFPLVAIDNFPAEIFSCDYKAALEEIHRLSAERHQAALAQHSEVRARYKVQRKGYLRELAWKAPLAGGVIVVGLVAAAVVPAMAAWGMHHAAGIMNGLGDHGALPLLPPSFDFVDLTEPAIAELMDEVKADAAGRRAALWST